MSDVIEDELALAPETSKVQENPFPGLRPFKIDESHLFFGREGQSDEVLLKLSKNRFVGVIGPSGSGKSSFIYCGVLPILYGGFLTNKSPNWDVIVSRPGASPIDNLAEAILEKDASYQSANKEEQQIKDTIITTLLRSSSLGLVEALLQNKKDTDKNYLILIDQFEELFRFKDSADAESVNETLAFINLLIEAINYSEVPIYVAITMRSDFVGDCAQFPDLTKKINDSHYLIPQMTREQKRKAITGPVAVGGADISPRLIQQLLNDLGDNPDQLPILQHSLMRTWSYWGQFGDIGEAVDLKHYEAIGTMKEALSLHANEAFDELNDDQKKVCEIIFKAITEKRGENFGIRRPTKLGEIAAIADVTEEEVMDVIEKFRAPGRSLITPAAGIPLSSNSIVDISHESLMRIWIRLKNWVNEEADAVQMYLRLAEAASMYQVGKAGLWRPPDLQLALNWQVKHKPTLVWGQRYHPAFERTLVFLEYSKKEFDTEQKIKELQRKRQLQRARVTALVLATATVISLLFLLYAFQQKAQADKNFAAAEEQRIEAVKQTALAKENAKKAQLATAEADKNFAAAEEQRIEAVKQTALAEQNAEQARIAQANADKRRIEAQKAEANAKEQEKIANTQKDVATAATETALAAKALSDELRYQAIAKSMAIKSTQLRENEKLKELEGLLAQQAYIFNTKYQGDVYDNDVYDGLYYAIRAYDDPLAQSLEGHEKAIRVVEASTTGNYIYSGGSQGKILRWKLDGENRVADTIIQARPNKDHVIRTLAVNNDNTIMLAGGDYPYYDNNNNTYIEVFDLSNPNSSPKKINGIRLGVTKLIFSKDEKSAFILENLGMSIKSTDFSKLNEVIVPDARVEDMALSFDGNWLFTADEKGVVNKYDLINGYVKTLVYDNGSKIQSIAVSQDNYIAIGDPEGTLQLINVNNTQDRKNLVGHESWINNIKFSTDNQFIATSSNDNTVRLWNRKNPSAQPIKLADHKDWVWSVAFTADNTQVMAGTTNKEIKAWPTLRDDMADKLCGYVTRNFSKDEWDTYVGEDLEREKTCENHAENND
jgi:WD40 repeat protein/energy-coupling factor transporter ATP-binding protein EcfA2